MCVPTVREFVFTFCVCFAVAVFIRASSELCARSVIHVMCSVYYVGLTFRLCVVRAERNGHRSLVRPVIWSV